MVDNKEDSSELSRIRSEIDSLDAGILELLAKRRNMSIEIAQEKDRQGRAFLDSDREADVLASRVEIGTARQLDSQFITGVFSQILDDSVRLQEQYCQGRLNRELGRSATLRVALQGIEGSYSQRASRQFFSEAKQINYLSFSNFPDVVKAVDHGRADMAVLPIENTTSGGITEVYDLLMRTQLSLIGEVKLKVEHCLLALPGTHIDDLTKIYSHPQAMLQCSRFLNERLSHCRLEYLSDTALSGKTIQESGEAGVGAIASEEAARLFGLEVLRRGITNREHNYTRFVIAARKAIDVDPRLASKTSLVLSVGNEPGALLEALSLFHRNGINLVKLESRPVEDNPWEEMFYLDFDGNPADRSVQLTIDGLTKIARFVKVLGCYPSRDLRPNRREPLESQDHQDSLASPSLEPAPVPIKIPEKVKGYRLASRKHKPEDTIIDVGTVRIGAEFFVIAGPCAVESQEQIFRCAEQAKAHGARILRGGCFKPRTSPYSFQGLGYEGLTMLAEAGRRHGLPIVTEVLSPEDVERVSEVSDILQIGARNMQNFTLLSEVGRSRRPVMLKRGMSSSIDELLQAAEYILAGGNQQVFLCERGIRTFETSTRNTLDLSAVPVLRQRTHLPVIIDPSHAAGNRELVMPLALAGKAVGAHGIMVEMHPEPEKALSDGPQSLEFDQFADLMTRLRSRKPKAVKTEV